MVEICGNFNFLVTHFPLAFIKFPYQSWKYLHILQNSSTPNLSQRYFWINFNRFFVLEKSFYISALTIKWQCCTQTFLIFSPGIPLWLLLLRLLALQLFLLGKRCCYSCRLIVTARADLMPFSVYLCRFKKKLSLCLSFASLELITFAHQYQNI